MRAPGVDKAVQREAVDVLRHELARFVRGEGLAVDESPVKGRERARREILGRKPADPHGAVMRDSRGMGVHRQTVREVQQTGRQHVDLHVRAGQT